MPRCGTECGAVINSTKKKKTDGKMTIADTITDTTFLTNYTSDSNFKLYTHNSYFAKCVYN